MKKIVIIALCLVFSIMFTQGQNSDIPTIEYDEFVDALMPISAKEVEFQFDGLSGDIIVIEASVSIDNILSGLFPEISLLNERGTQIASTSDITGGLENFDLYTSTLPIELPADGLYTILITTGDFSTLQMDAPFTLRLLKPEILELDKTLDGFVDTNFSSYYIIISNTTFSVEYERKDGSFYPAVNVGRIADGNLEPLGSMYGESMIGGSLILEPNRNTLHLVTITTSPFDLGNIFTVNDAEYMITLRQ